MRAASNSMSPPTQRNAKMKQNSKSVPRRKISPRKNKNQSHARQQSMMEVIPQMSTSRKQANAAGQRSALQETFQMISDVDTKLQKGAATSNRGLFDEDAHNAKRQVLLQRAAEAKRRIEAQNAVQSLQKKPNFELIEDCKLLNTTRCLNCYQFGSSLLIYFII